MDLSRRSFILGVSAASFVAAATGALAQGAAATRKVLFPNFEKLVRHLAQHADVICLAEDNHLDLQSGAPLSARNVLAAMRDEGVTDIYLELSYEFDDRAKRLLRGEMGRTLFIGQLLQDYNDYLKNLPVAHKDKIATSDTIKFYDSIANIIEAARDVGGIEVHCADPLTFRGSMEMAERLAGAPDAATFVERLQTERLVRDGSIAERIEATRRGKAAVQFGAWHFLFRSSVPFLPFEKPQYNIDDNLRARGVTTATVHISNDGGSAWNVILKGLRELPQLWTKVTGAESADFDYAPRTDRFIRKNPAFPPVPSAGAPLSLTPR